MRVGLREFLTLGVKFFNALNKSITIKAPNSMPVDYTLNLPSGLVASGIGYFAVDSLGNSSFTTTVSGVIRPFITNLNGLPNVSNHLGAIAYVSDVFGSTQIGALAISNGSTWKLVGTEDIFNSTPTYTNASLILNNLNIGGSSDIYRTVTPSTTNLTGIAGGYHGRKVSIWFDTRSSGSGNFNVLFENSASLEANRIAQTGDRTFFTSNQNKIYKLDFIYDGISQRWQLTNLPLQDVGIASFKGSVFAAGSLYAVTGGIVLPDYTLATAAALDSRTYTFMSDIKGSWGVGGLARWTGSTWIDLDGRVATTSGLYRSVSSDRTLSGNDKGCVVDVDASTGTKNIILPDSTLVGDSWKCYVGKSDSVSNSVNILTSGLDTIDGITRLSLTRQYQRVFLGSNGSGRFMVFATVPGRSSVLTDWLTRVGTAGGSVNSIRQTAIENLIQTLENNSLLSKFSYLLIYNGTDGFTGCNVPLIRPVGVGNATFVNLVAGDRSSGGLLGSDNKYVDTGFNPQTWVSSINEVSLIKYIDQDILHGSYYFGSFSSTGSVKRFHGGWITDGVGDGESGIGTVTLNSPVISLANMLTYTRTSGSLYQFYRNTSLIGTSTSTNTDTTPLNNTLYDLALNFNGSPTAFNIGVTASLIAVVNSGLENSQVSILNSAFSTCHNSLKLA